MAKFHRSLVRQRAKFRCEYCHLPENCTTLPHELDHIRAKKHRGTTNLENTCWACSYCNSFKGPNVAGYDPETSALTALFHPRKDRWEKHFEWDGPVLVGITDIGRTTIDTLRINDASRLEHRLLLIEAKQWRP